MVSEPDLDLDPDSCKKGHVRSETLFASTLNEFEDKEQTTFHKEI